MLRTLKDIDVKGKRALVRVDLNVPLGDDSKIDKNESWRIEAIVPTLKYLIKQKAKIVLISHLGRPRGVNKKFSLKPVAKELSRLLNKKIVFNGKSGDIVMLENIRFKPGEEKNSPKLAQDLAKLGDFFVNDAFAVSHREHASIVGIPKYLDSVVGLLFEKEIKELDKVLDSKKPLIAIIGVAKIATKIKVINRFSIIGDKVLIGGALANDIFAAQGISMGKSLIDKNSFSEVEKLDLTGSKFFLPVDLAVWDGEKVRYCEIDDVREKEKALDVGPKTINLFCDLIKDAKTIIWNGPLGYYTKPPFDKSCVEITKAINDSKAYSVVGGGDTVAFLRSIDKDNIFNHVSTGGGAMLDYLANETLPGIIALEK